MRTINQTLRTGKSTFFALAAVLLLSLSSCAKKLSFNTSMIAPAASGSVKISKDKNKNYAIDVFVRNLAPSDKLTPPRETYVVWVDTESNGVKNIGQINTSTGLLSKTLKASLKANLPFKPVRVFITGEDMQNVQYPGNMVVLSTDSF